MAASERFRDALGALFLFGGFYSFWLGDPFRDHRTRVCRGVAIDVPHDPLNAPAVFINLIDHLNVPDEDAALLRRTWLEMARRTWGQRALFDPARRHPIAEALARDVPREHRDLFLIGWRASWTAAPRSSEAGIAHAGDHFAFTDPASAPRAHRCPGRHRPWAGRRRLPGE